MEPSREILLLEYPTVPVPVLAVPIHRCVFQLLLLHSPSNKILKKHFAGRKEDSHHVHSNCGNPETRHRDLTNKGPKNKLN